MYIPHSIGKSGRRVLGRQLQIGRDRMGQFGVSLFGTIRVSLGRGSSGIVPYISINHLCPPFPGLYILAQHQSYLEKAMGLPGVATDVYSY